MVDITGRKPSIAIIDDPLNPDARIKQVAQQIADSLGEGNNITYVVNVADRIRRACDGFKELALSIDDLRSTVADIDAGMVRLKRQTEKPKNPFQTGHNITRTRRHR